MKAIVTSVFALLLISLAGQATIEASPDESLKVAKAVKLYIFKEHKRRKSDPKPDLEKIHKICGKARLWTKGCRFWKSSGKDKYMFQVRPRGKIYGVPSMFL